MYCISKKCCGGSKDDVLDTFLIQHELNNLSHAKKEQITSCCSSIFDIFFNLDNDVNRVKYNTEYSIPLYPPLSTFRKGGAKI